MDTLDGDGSVVLVRRPPSEAESSRGGGYDQTMSFGTDIVEAVHQGETIPLWYGQARVTQVLSGHGFQIRQAELLRETNEIITISTVVGDGDGWGKVGGVHQIPGITQYAVIKYSRDTGARTGFWDFSERSWSVEFNDYFNVTFPANGDWSLLPASAHPIRNVLMRFWNHAVEDFPAFFDSKQGLKGGVALDRIAGGGHAERSDLLSIRFPRRFKPRFVDMIVNFNPSEDVLKIDRQQFDLGGEFRFATAMNRKSLARLAREDHDFLYDLSSGWLYYNQNGSDKGFGNGGICAIIQGAPALSVDSFELF